MQDISVPSIPHMAVVDKLWQFPVIEYAFNTSYDFYGKVKASHDVINWTFTTAEGAVQKAVEHVAPVAMKFEQPIHAVDQKLCQGLNKLEEKLPLVKQPPCEMYANAKSYVSATIQPAVQVVQGSAIFQEVQKINMNVKSLKDLSWAKANDMLSSPYGHLALTGLDSTSGMADRCIDYYMPDDSDLNQDDLHVHPSSECDDKVSHAVHTVGVLSNKVSRRVYHAVSTRVNQINKQNVNEYLRSLALVVQLTTFLNNVNRRVEYHLPNPTENGRPQQ